MQIKWFSNFFGVQKRKELKEQLLRDIWNMVVLKNGRFTEPNKGFEDKVDIKNT